VAALVACGLTSRQIGERLFITEGTAALHVKHILAKLGFTSRAQVAAWAVEQRLATPLTGDPSV
jgi:non-specific serine/threonine protein kinase